MSVGVIWIGERVSGSLWRAIATYLIKTTCVESPCLNIRYVNKKEPKRVNFQNFGKRVKRNCIRSATLHIPFLFNGVLFSLPFLLSFFFDPKASFATNYQIIISRATRLWLFVLEIFINYLNIFFLFLV